MTHTKERPLELCHMCDEPTGRAGIGDGSLYCECDRGPFCLECWNTHHEADTRIVAAVNACAGQYLGDGADVKRLVDKVKEIAEGEEHYMGKESALDYDGTIEAICEELRDAIALFVESE